MCILKQVLFCCLLLTATALVLSAPSSVKIEPTLAKSLQSGNSVNIFVKFQNDKRLSVLKSTERLRFATRAQKLDHLVTSLKSISQSSQQNALNFLRSRFSFSTVSHKQMWATNELYIKGANVLLISQLAALPEVAEIRQERVIPLDHFSFDQPTLTRQNENTNSSNNLEWNIEMISANLAWQLPGGTNGHGVVVANIDSGVRHTHESLRNNYRESYGWFDPHTDSEFPVDEGGHGTHTIGTIAGSGGIGVAPGVQWIACKACGQYSCPESALKACGEWILCPTNGTHADCNKAPQVVSNSWGSSAANDFYNEIIEAWKAAGIIPVFSIGNSGPACGTAMAPGDQDVIAVGATTSDDNIWVSSSVGPSVAGLVKPDISAPGHQIRSAGITNDTAYYITSGSSMASPHVSGVVALLLSHNPALTYTQIKQILESNTDTNDLVDTGKTCGGISSTEFPNNQYGHGRLNARKALEAAINT